MTYIHHFLGFVDLHVFEIHVDYFHNGMQWKLGILKKKVKIYVNNEVMDLCRTRMVGRQREITLIVYCFAFCLSL